VLRSPTSKQALKQEIKAAFQAGISANAIKADLETNNLGSITVFKKVDKVCLT